jgi:hypothetical protein
MFAKESFLPKRCSMPSRSLAIRSEFPPRSKKLSVAPMSALQKRLRQTSTNPNSNASFGGTSCVVLTALGGAGRE